MGEIEPVAQRLEQACSDGTTPATACVVVHDGKVVHRSAHGITCIRPAVAALPVGHDTLFDVASLTKVMATTAIAMALYSERRLDLKAQVGRFLLEFARSKTPQPLTPLAQGNGKQSITVEDLLAHRSGLPAWRPYWERVAADMVASRVFRPLESRPKGSPLYGAFRRARYLAREAIVAESLEQAPRTKVVYSDTGFMILGMLLERAGGAPLDVLFHKLVAGPLKLRNTFFVDETRHPAVRPQCCAATRSAGSRGGATLLGEVDDDNAFALAGVAGHAGLFSTATDVALFGEGMRRLWEGERIGTLRPSAAHAFLRRDALGLEGSRALGFDIPSPRDSAAGELMSRDATFGHLGFTGCSLWFDLSRRVTVALVTNRVHNGADTAPVRRLRAEIHDMVVSSLGDSGRGPGMVGSPWRRD